MTEVAKARDWLGEIHALGGREDEDKLRALVTSIAAAAPELEERVCDAVSERGGDDEEARGAWKHWAREFFEEAEAKRAEGKVVPLFSPALQPRVEVAPTERPLRRRRLTEPSAAGAGAPTFRELKAAMAAGEALRAEAAARAKAEEAARAEPKPEAAAEPGRALVILPPPPLPGFFTSSEQPEAAEEQVIILDPATPFDNAQKLVSLRAWHRGERIRTLQYWQRSFWNGVVIIGGRQRTRQSEQRSGTNYT